MTTYARWWIAAAVAAAAAACDPVPSASIDAAPTEIDAGEPEAPIDAPIEDPPDGRAPRNLVFVSSKVVTGNLGGRSKADELCNTLAHDAGHDGTFRAWLSAEEDAITRLEGARGWERVDGKPVADAPDQVAAGRLFHPIRTDEKGLPLTDKLFVYTATDGGRRPGMPTDNNTCKNWTSEVATDLVAGGDASSGGPTFSRLTNLRCSAEGRIYCFQIDHKEPVAAPVVEARLAFATRAAWLPKDGVTAADAFCQGEGDARNLGKRFKALLATGGADAASRFRPTDGPWKRLDGILVTATTAELFDDTRDLDAPINITLDDMYLGLEQAWTGAPGFKTPPTMPAVETCNDWKPVTGSTGSYIRAGSTRKAPLTGACTSARKLLCLEVDGT